MMNPSRDTNERMHVELGRRGMSGKTKACEVVGRRRVLAMWRQILITKRGRAGETCVEWVNKDELFFSRPPVLSTQRHHQHTLCPSGFFILAIQILWPQTEKEKYNKSRIYGVRSNANVPGTRAQQTHQPWKYKKKKSRTEQLESKVETQYEYQLREKWGKVASYLQ